MVVALDQLTKSWAVARLSPPNGPIHVIGSLEMSLAHNTGMAFSKAQGGGPVIAVVALAIVGVLIWFAQAIHTRAGLVVVGLVIGGALGNVVDRLLRAPAPGQSGGFLRGAVVDFIALRWWPTFNLADSAVVVGGLLLALIAFRGEPTGSDGDG